MEIGINIDKSGASERIGKNLQDFGKTTEFKQPTNSTKNNEADNIVIDTSNLSNDIKTGITESLTDSAKNATMDAVSGAANVLASTGINIGVGSTDQIIADNIAAAVNLTGEQGLNNLAANLEGYSQQLTSMGLNAPEQIVEIVLAEIEAALCESGVIPAVKKGLDIVAGTVDLGKKGLQYANSAATIVANIGKLMTKINKMQDVDITCVPTVKDQTLAIGASLIDQIISQYNALKQQLILFYNSMICTSNDAVLDNILVSANNILEVVEPALDPIIQKYTGFTICEIRNVCNQGFAYIGMIQRAAAKKRKENEEAEKAAANGDVILDEEIDETTFEDNAKETANKMKDNIVSAGNDLKDKAIEGAGAIRQSVEEKAKAKKEKLKKSVDKWKKKTQDLSKEEAKEKLLEWLSEQSIMIQNAFHIVVIKQTIDQIKVFIEQLQNTSIENQVDLLNSLTDVLSIFNLLGITPDAKGLTIEDLKALGMGAVGTIVETGVNIGEQVKNNAQAVTDNIINQYESTVAESGGLVNTAVMGGNSAIGNAKNVVAGVSNAAHAFASQSVDNASQTDGVSMTSVDSDIATTKAVDIAKATGSAIASSMIGDSIDNVIGAVMNVDSAEDIMNMAADFMGDTGASITGPFKYTQSNQDKNIIIDVTLYQNPKTNPLRVLQFISAFKSGSGKEIFNKGKTKEIRDGFYDAWEYNESIELNISAIVDKITKRYIFNIVVDQTAYNNAQKNKNKDKGNQTNGDSGLTTSLIDDAQNGLGNLMNNTSTQVNNLMSGTMGTAGNMMNSVMDSAGNIANGVMDSAGNIADEAFGQVEGAVSQLTNVNINIDMSAIEKVLEGKVLMFDEVVQFLKILLPIVEILKTVCHILQNYKINKEWVKTKQRVNLADALARCAEMVNGLKGLLSLFDKNFFTVRTQETADWINKTFDLKPDNAGMITIEGASTEEIMMNQETLIGYNIAGIADSIENASNTINNLFGNETPNEHINQTRQLNSYVISRNIKLDEPLDLNKKTVIYFDEYSIKNGGFKDGTFNGLDNIEFNKDRREIYYDSSNRSTISSEILRAVKKQVNPKYVSDNAVSANNDPIDNLLQSIIVQTDEMEGTQSISLNDLNLCEPMNLGDETPAEKSAVIIEFGDEYTMGNKIDFTWNVKPGDTINENTVLAYIKKNNKQYPVKSIFKGTVRKTNDSDFYHVYPTYAKRHIILDNTTPCLPPEYDTKKTLDISKKFKKAIELESFILSSLVPSILPTIIANANHNGNNDIGNGGVMISNGNLSKPTEVFSTFNNTITDYNNYILEKIEELKENNSSDSMIPQLSGEKFGKKCGSVDIHAAEKQGNIILDIRKEMINQTISVYNNVINNIVNGSYSYEDCIGLAFNNDDFVYDVNDTKIKNYNYYIDILSKTPKTNAINISMAEVNANMSNLNNSISTIQGDFFNSSIYKEGTAEQKEMANSIANAMNMSNISKAIGDIQKATQDNDGENYIEEYKTILKNIIDERLSLESHTKIETLNEFNNYYKANISNLNNDILPYDKLVNLLGEDNLTNYDEIIKLIKIDYLTARYGNKINENTFANYDKDEMGDADKGQKYYNACYQAATTFIYIITNGIDENKKVPLELESCVIQDDLSIETIKYILDNQSVIYFKNNKAVVFNEKTYESLYDLIYDVYSYHIINKPTNTLITSVSLDGISVDSGHNIKLKTLKTLKDLLNINEYEIESYIDAVGAINNFEDNNANKANNTINENTMIFFNRKLNEVFFELTKKESATLIEFWNKIIKLYQTEYNIDAIIQEMKDYADSMNALTKWPNSINIKIGTGNYELYTFIDSNIEKKKPDETIDYFPDDFEEPLSIPEAVVDTSTRIINEPQLGDITIMDYEYWLVYMLNASLFTILPSYWADGLGIPPFIPTVPLPAIYLPIAPPVMIPKVNVLMVFGIAIRGIWPAPIILMVNLSSDNIDVFIIFKILLDIVKDIFKRLQEYVENGIPAMINGIVNGYIAENKTAQKVIDKFRTYSSIIKAIPIENKALIDKQFNEVLNEELNKQMAENKNNFSKLTDASKSINEAERDAYKKIKKTGQKIYDRRQVITREADLGAGEPPM